MKPGQPAHWNERFVDKLKGVELPDGAVFFTTPSHGYLRIDTRKLSAKVSDCDYRDGPHHILLEEDCSLPMWLTEAGLIPFNKYTRDMIDRIPRKPVE